MFNKLLITLVFVCGISAGSAFSQSNSFSFSGQRQSFTQSQSSTGGGHSGTDTFNDGRGASCERGQASFCPPKNVPSAPGPLPVLGAAAAFGYSRKLRNRIRNSQTANII